MKKFIILIVILISFCIPSSLMAAGIMWAYDGTTGGTAGKIDNIDQCNSDKAGRNLVDKDGVIAWDQAAGKYLFYIYNAASTDAESGTSGSETVIEPNYCDGGAIGVGRWIKVDLEGVGGLLTTLLAAKADESIVGTSLNADDLVNDGGVLKTAAEIPHIDAAQTWTATQGFNTFLLTPLTTEPTEVVGQIYRASDPWNPCGLPGSPAPDYFVVCTAADTYVALFDVTGDFKFSTIQAAMKVTPDTSGGRVIALSEMNGIIYLTDDGPFDVDIPDGECDAAADIGKWVTVMTDANDQASLTSLDASNHFINDDLTDFGAGDELDIDGNSVTVMCIAAEYWKVTGWTGAQPTDGGAAD